MATANINALLKSFSYVYLVTETGDVEIEGLNTRRLLCFRCGLHFPTMVVQVLDTAVCPRPFDTHCST